LQKQLAELKIELDREKAERDTEKQKMITEKQEVDEKLTEYEAEKEKIALEAFEKDKKDILELCKTSGLKEEQIAEITEKLESPKNLATVKALVNMMTTFMPKKEDKKEDDEPKKPTQGKAPMVPPPPEDSKEYLSGIQMVDELYKIAYDKTGVYTKQQKKAADDKINKLWNALIGGQSWKQLKKGATMAGVSGKQIMSCPRCKGTIVTEPPIPDKCPYCGFDFTKTGDIHPIDRGGR